MYVYVSTAIRMNAQIASTDLLTLAILSESWMGARGEENALYIVASEYSLAVRKKTYKLYLLKL